MNLNGVEYYYIRNAQNDIIGLFDKNGATVASYTYDTWGKLISIKDGSGTDITNNTASVGYKNPYRYRGYRYDSETQLYYLQSRYYSPDWGRFINADAEGGKIGTLLSHNSFAYCMNNPVNMADPEGNFAWWIAGGIIGAVVGGIAGAIYSYETTGSVDWRYVAGGAVAGALVGSGLGWLAETAYTAVTAAATASGAVAAKVFWSGGEVAKNAAETYAKSNGATTLEMTKKGIDLTNKTKDMAWEQAKPLWESASREFAKGAEGAVHVFQRAEGVRLESVWAKIEHPQLLGNPNVTKFIYHIIMPDGNIKIFQ